MLKTVKKSVVNNEAVDYGNTLHKNHSDRVVRYCGIQCCGGIPFVLCVLPSHYMCDDIPQRTEHPL